jgi:hypothetical protein
MHVQLISTYFNLYPERSATRSAYFRVFQLIPTYFSIFPDKKISWDSPQMNADSKLTPHPTLRRGTCIGRGGREAFALCDPRQFAAYRNVYQLKSASFFSAR